MEGKIKELKKLLSKEKKIIITTHTNPDGDAIGSSLGLYHFLKKTNHNVNVVTPNRHPEFLNWVPGCDDIIIYEENKELGKKLIDNCDLLFTLDFNNLNRSGLVGENINLKKHEIIMIDHHQSPSDYSNITFSYPKISSTCELIFKLITRLTDIDLIDKDISTCIYLGMMTDTGSFQYNSVNSETHSILSVLMDKGIDHSKVYNNIYNSNNLSKLRILGSALNNLNQIKESKTTYMTLTKTQLVDKNYKKGDTEGLVNYGLSLKNIDFTAIFIEDIDEVNNIKISFRSKNLFPCDKFAKKFFNGGGHKNAAGGKYLGSIDNAVTKFKSSLKDFNF